MSLKRNIARVFSANAIQTIASIIIGFVVPAILSIEGYAGLKTYTLFTTYAGILHFGFVDGIYLKYGGKNEKFVDKGVLKAEHRFLVLFQLLMTVICLGISFLIHDKVVLLFSISILPINLLNFHKMFYQAVGNFKKYSLLMHIYSIAYVGINIVLALLIKSENFVFYCLALFAANMITLLIGEMFFFIKTHGVKANYSKDVLRNINVGFFLLLGNLAAVFLYAIDKWTIKLFYDTSDFSYYSFAVSLFNIIIVLLNSISLTFYNVFARGISEERVRSFKKILLVLGAASTGVYYGLVWIIQHFLSKYEPSLMIIAYSFATFPYLFAIKAIFVNLYKSRRLEKRYTKVVIGMLILSALLNAVVTIVWKSAEAVAIATLISFVIWYLFSFKDFRFLSPSWRELLYLIICTSTFIATSHTFNCYYGLIVYYLVFSVSTIGLIGIRPRDIKAILGNKN